MADHKNVDSGEESGDSRTGSSNSIVSDLNSTDETAAVIPEESRLEAGPESGHENQALSSTDETKDSSCNSESVSGSQEAMLKIVDTIFELRRRLNLERGSNSNSSNGPSNQEQDIRPRGPASRNLPPDCFCFLKNLTLTDASHVDGMLDLQPLKAVWIPSCPQILREAHDMRKSVELMVFDYENTQYNMVLTGYNYEGIVLYNINGEWRKFIRAHDLQHGDTIFFYKNRDLSVNGDDFYYVILFTRKGDGKFMYADPEENEGKKN